MKIAQQQLRQIYPKPVGCSGGLVFLGLERLSGLSGAEIV